MAAALAPCSRTASFTVVVYGDAILKFLPALSGGNAGHDVGTVLDALRRVKTAGAAGDALDDYSCILVY